MKHVIQNKKYTALDIADIIDKHIVGSKAYRNREILKAKYIDGYTFEEIAEKFKMSPQQIKNICYNGLDKIADYIV